MSVPCVMDDAAVHAPTSSPPTGVPALRGSPWQQTGGAVEVCAYAHIPYNTTFCPVHLYVHTNAHTNTHTHFVYLLPVPTHLPQPNPTPLYFPPLQCALSMVPSTYMGIVSRLAAIGGMTTSTQYTVSVCTLLHFSVYTVSVCSPLVEVSVHVLHQ